MLSQIESLIKASLIINSLNNKHQTINLLSILEQVAPKYIVESAISAINNHLGEAPHKHIKLCYFTTQFRPNVLYKVVRYFIGVLQKDLTN